MSNQNLTDSRILNAHKQMVVLLFLCDLRAFVCVYMCVGMEQKLKIKKNKLSGR